jgi:hypothetical protein
MITIIKSGFPEAGDSVETDVLQAIEQFIEADAISMVSA